MQCTSDGEHGNLEELLRVHVRWKPVGVLRRNLYSVEFNTWRLTQLWKIKNVCACAVYNGLRPDFKVVVVL